jgi:hypothetical protein
MNNGIRAYARDTFVAQNELRRRGECYTGTKGNTEFRKNVMCLIMEEHGVTLASAATHYNDAFKFIKELNAELVSGLGRADDKKGGRKPKAKPDAVLTTEETVTLLLEHNGAPATLADEGSLLLGINVDEEVEA